MAAKGILIQTLNLSFSLSIRSINIGACTTEENLVGGKVNHIMVRYHALRLQCCGGMTNHHCFCARWCKFSCSIPYEKCEIILAKLLLKFNPVSSVKDSFKRHSFLSVNNKVTPLDSGAPHLALNLGIVSMILFQSAHNNNNK